MPRVLIVVLLSMFSLGAYAQRDSTRSADTSKIKIDLGNWQEGVHPSSPPGIVFRFDYTKFFEWLLPKKKPLIPPDCDPKNMRDWLPDTTKPDSTKIKMPV
jgi:hypothetical protein